MWRLLLLFLLPQVCCADFVVDDVQTDFFLTTSAFDSANNMSDSLNFNGFSEGYSLSVSHVGAPIGDEQFADISGNIFSTDENTFDFLIVYDLLIGGATNTAASAFGQQTFDFTIDARYTIEIFEFSFETIFVAIEDSDGVLTPLEGLDSLELGSGSYSLSLSFDDSVSAQDASNIAFGFAALQINFVQTVPEPGSTLLLTAIAFSTVLTLSLIHI